MPQRMCDYRRGDTEGRTSLVDERKEEDDGARQCWLVTIACGALSVGY
jgi:hypothetical protein